jgi:hypothetical protein
VTVTGTGVPSAPQNFTARALDANSVLLSWDDPGDISITGYEVSHGLTHPQQVYGSGSHPVDHFFSDWKPLPGSGAGTVRHVARGLPSVVNMRSPVAYTFEVRAVNAAGAGAGSARASLIPANGTDAVTGVSLHPATLTLAPGGAKAVLSPTVSPWNATDKSVAWQSSDPAVATVVDGLVTPLAAGTATVTATAGGLTATCAVTVARPSQWLTLSAIDVAPSPGFPGALDVTLSWRTNQLTLANAGYVVHTTTNLALNVWEQTPAPAVSLINDLHQTTVTNNAERAKFFKVEAVQ